MRLYTMKSLAQSILVTFLTWSSARSGEIINRAFAQQLVEQVWCDKQCTSIALKAIKPAVAEFTPQITARVCGLFLVVKDFPNNKILAI